MNVMHLQQRNRRGSETSDSMSNGDANTYNKVVMAT